MPRRRSAKIRKLLEELERGHGIWVTKSEYNALVPYLKEYKQKGRHPVVVHTFLEDAYFITLQPLILI